jgi:peptidoglycan hydrolase-like protein with peptidoglycan-binding domain
MRFWVLALSLLGFLVSSDAAKAGLSSTTRDPSLSVEATTSTDEATQQTENQLGLDRAKRRDVQRRLTGLGFDTKVNGRFGKSTRAAIGRWQVARGYPETGFLNAPQHNALLTEAVSGTLASTSDETDSDRPARRRGGGAHHHRGGGGGGPIRLIGGMVGGLFGRR